MIKPKAPSSRVAPQRKPRTTSAPAPSKGTFLRFYHSAALRKKTLAVLTALEGSTDPTQHRTALADVVVELTRSGMDSYFMTPLKLSKAGFITEQSAALGMSGAVKVLSAVIRNIIGGMGSPQLLSVCGSIRNFMR